MNLTIAYITSRSFPRFDWFLDSLARTGFDGQIIIVDFYANNRHSPGFEQAPSSPLIVYHGPPKPTVWQGPHRLTSQDCWAASNARNTAICLCKTEHIAFLDDRCVLMPTWLESVKNAIESNRVVAGTYEKRTGMTVENGVIKHAGIIIGEDARAQYTNKYWNGQQINKCPGSWLFGCCLALPLEWALEVNGYEELCDGLGMEDIVFGAMLENCQHPIFFDMNMKMVEDRTPDYCSPIMEKTSKEKHANDVNDKGHAAIKKFMGLKRSNSPDLRAIRESVLAMNPFPIPTEPTHDWFDGMPLRDMKIVGGRIVS